MKQSQLTSLDLYYLLKELQNLIGAKVDHVYNPSRKEIVLQLHLANVGKKILIIRAPDAMWLADVRPETKEISQFCKILRKYLINSRLCMIKQLGFERIAEFVFDKKEKYSLIFELFSKGNVILAKNNVIIAAAEQQRWAARTIKPKEEYKLPAKEFNFLELKIDDFKKMLAKTDRESAVKALAIELGLGGSYSEEACILAGIDKNKKPNELDGEEIKKLFNAFSELKGKKADEDIVYRFKGVTISSGQGRYLKRIEEIERIIAEQKATIKSLEDSGEENKRKGEFIYERYNLIKEIIEQIKAAREKYSWKEIKEKLKGHKMVKDVNEKEKSIILELK